MHSRNLLPSGYKSRDGLYWALMSGLTLTTEVKPLRFSASPSLAVIFLATWPSSGTSRKRFNPGEAIARKR